MEGAEDKDDAAGEGTDLGASGRALGFREGISTMSSIALPWLDRPDLGLSDMLSEPR